jgi:hypothetical protein
MPLLYTFNTYSWIFFEKNPYIHFLKLGGIGGIAVLAMSTLFYIAIERPSLVWAKSAKALQGNAQKIQENSEIRRKEKVASMENLDSTAG